MEAREHRGRRIRVVLVIACLAALAVGCSDDTVEFDPIHGISPPDGPLPWQLLVDQVYTLPFRCRLSTGFNVESFQHETVATGPIELVAAPSPWQRNGLGIQVVGATVQAEERDTWYYLGSMKPVRVKRLTQEQMARAGRTMIANYLDLPYNREASLARTTLTSYWLEGQIAVLLPSDAREKVATTISESQERAVQALLISRAIPNEGVLVELRHGQMDDAYLVGFQDTTPCVTWQHRGNDDWRVDLVED